MAPGSSHAWRRLVLLGVVLALGVVTVLAERGPAWFQRYYYPLRYESAIEDSAIRHTINPYVVSAVIEAESGFEPDRASQAGAVGLMQVLPSTAQDLKRRGIVSDAVTGGRDLTD